jgi:pimeloyl-ACP methyl ester carboxylesterase
MTDADLLRVPVGPGFVHVERYGQGGEPIVLLHGFPTSSFLWRAVAPALTEAGLVAYAMDLLGYGESDRPFDGDFSVSAQSHYLDRALTALRIPAAAVAGVDIGGGVALHLAATRPERVTRLVLINSVGFDAWPGDDVRMVQTGTARFALRIARGVLGAAPLLTPLLERSVADPSRMPARLVARYLAPFVGADGVLHLLTLARALDPDDLSELDLSAVRAPTLVVRGEEDHWLDDSLADRLRAALPGEQLARLPGVARLVPEEAPDQLAALIAGFVTTPAGVGGSPGAPPPTEPGA